MIKGLYKIFNYTEKQIKEIEYLADLVDVLNINSMVEEGIFQFSPRLVQEKTEKFNEHEPWAIFHKEQIILETTCYLLEQIIDDEYVLEDEINSVINDDKYIDFILKNDLRNLSKYEIINKFKDYYSSNYHLRNN